MPAVPVGRGAAFQGRAKLRIGEESFHRPTQVFTPRFTAYLTQEMLSTSGVARSKLLSMQNSSAAEPKPNTCYVDSAIDEPTMKLSKKAYSRRERERVLVDATVQNAAWNPATGTVAFTVKGSDGPSTYNYKFQFTADELESLFSTTVAKSAADATGQAACKAFITFWRELVTKGTAK